MQILFKFVSGVGPVSKQHTHSSSKSGGQLFRRQSKEADKCIVDELSKQETY
jgi:hypothetical protein